jgi:hypothetical protein
VTVHIVDSGQEFKVAADFAPREREILICGGLLRYLKHGGTPVATAAQE